MFVIVFGAFLGGMAVRGLAHDTSTSNAVRRSNGNSGSGAVASRRPGPSAYRDGIPTGFERTKDGARAAAVAYVLTGRTLINLAPTLVDNAVRSMSAKASADGQVASATQQLMQLRKVLAAGTGPTRYLQAVLATRTDAVTQERARVSVWNVGVLSRDGVAAPQAGWTTSVFELVWEHDDWKIWSEAITPGPAPALNAGVAPATSQQLESALNEFTPWELRS